MGKHTLIITEKPDAAHRIASALTEKGKIKEMEDNGVPYYICRRDREIVVVPALGHLYTIAEERKGRNHYPAFNFRWVPKHSAERRISKARRWIETISKLADGADTFIDACDYDIEGSVIGYCILRFACSNKENISKRMRYSTLTKDELELSYNNLLPQLDFALIEAGIARHEVDWLYGVNLSRALTIAAKNWSGKYATLSTGRVQGPTLMYIVTKERIIRSFVPKPYWKINVRIQLRHSVFEAEYKKKIERKGEAAAVASACKEEEGKVRTIDVREFQQKPPAPFNLGTLQSEAYSLFGYTPNRTSRIAQRLYLEALISYPRTSSQKLPIEINYERILNKLKDFSKYRKLAEELLSKSELKPREGKKIDPAHPAIYPTGNKPETDLRSSEEKVLDLVARRFMAVFSESAIKQSMRVHIDINGHCFYLRGRRILKEGWLTLYKPYVRSEEILLPPIKEGQIVKIKKVILEDNFTKPPPRYNPASLLRKMEETGIGTKATRANVIKTLYDRKYIREEKIVVSDLGFEVLEVLEKYCPSVVSIELTSELEERMNKIQAKKEDKEGVLVDTVKMLKPIMEELKKKEKIVGEQLSIAIRKAKLEERIVGSCRVCGTGKLMILYSRKTRKRFIGCTNYFEGKCETSFPLPQKGSIKPLRKNCNRCGWPTVQVQRRGKRPWTLCFNPNCPLKDERRKNR